MVTEATSKKTPPPPIRKAKANNALLLTLLTAQVATALIAPAEAEGTVDPLTTDPNALQYAGDSICQSAKYADGARGGPLHFDGRERRVAGRHTENGQNTRMALKGVCTHDGKFEPHPQHQAQGQEYRPSRQTVTHHQAARR